MLEQYLILCRPHTRTAPIGLRHIVVSVLVIAPSVYSGAAVGMGNAESAFVGKQDVVPFIPWQDAHPQ